MRPPNAVIGLVDHAVTVAVGAGKRQKAASLERFAPEHIVGAIHAVVAVVVAWQRWFHYRPISVVEPYQNGLGAVGVRLVGAAIEVEVGHDDIFSSGGRRDRRAEIPVAGPQQNAPT